MEEHNARLVSTSITVTNALHLSTMRLCQLILSKQIITLKAHFNDKKKSKFLIKINILLIGNQTLAFFRNEGVRKHIINILYEDKQSP